jgi:GntR family transcriptional regulator
MAAKYDRIAADIRHKIATGRYPAGSRLPVETDMMGDYGVSLSTVRRALEVLEAEGLIEKQHGTGNFVKERRQKVRRTTERYQWEKERVGLEIVERSETGATEYDTGLGIEDFDFRAVYDKVPADNDLAEAFSVTEGTALLRRVYETRRVGERAPLGIGTSYLMLELISANPDLLDAANEPWPGGTQHQLSTVGIEVDRIIDRVTARPATSAEAEALDTRPGSALLALRKTSIDTDDRVVEVADIIWPGDRIEMFYTTQLQRWQA